jgi:hypothetical protein
LGLFLRCKLLELELESSFPVSSSLLIPPRGGGGGTGASSNWALTFCGTKYFSIPGDHGKINLTTVGRRVLKI